MVLQRAPRARGGRGAEAAYRPLLQLPGSGGHGGPRAHGAPAGRDVFPRVRAPRARARARRRPLRPPLADRGRLHGGALDIPGGVDLRPRGAVDLRDARRYRRPDTRRARPAPARGARFRARSSHLRRLAVRCARIARVARWDADRGRSASDRRGPRKALLALRAAPGHGVPGQLGAAFGSDLMDVAVARRYRDRILAPGGTKPAADLVRDFLGRPYDLRAFKAWLAPRD